MVYAQFSPMHSGHQEYVDNSLRNKQGLKLHEET